MVIACFCNLTCATGFNYGEIWEYNVTNKQFYYFQTLSHGLGGRSVNHFFYENTVYVYYTQQFNPLEATHYHFIFKWFAPLIFVRNTTKTLKLLCCFNNSQKQTTIHKTNFIGQVLNLNYINN